jgi:ribose transport system permease protein
MSQPGTSAQSTTRRAGNSIRRLIGSTGPLLVFVIMAVLLWITAPAFRSPTSIMLLALEAAAIGVVAAGQTFVILTGGIDLSVEAMVSFSGVVAAILIAGTNMTLIAVAAVVIGGT